MLFVVGDVDDEKRHNSFCSKSKAGPVMTSIKGLTELARFEDDKDVIVEIKAKHKRSQHQQDAIDSLMQVVQAELGSEAGFVSAHPDGSQCQERETLLLYLRDKVVLACIVTQPVHPSKIVAMSASVTSTEVDIALPAGPALGGATESENKKPQENAAAAAPPSATTLGIKLMWTARAARKQGHCRRLLDAARKGFEFGRVVRREHVAFSQPTADGLALALAYCGRDSIWGYA
jgi:hypothetical protein